MSIFTAIDRSNRFKGDSQQNAWIPIWARPKISAQSSLLFVDKSGFERQVYNFAYQAGFAYGAVTIAMVLGFGYAGFVVFRRRA